MVRSMVRQPVIQSLFEDAEAFVRARCLENCPALLCQRSKRCMALLDTPAFYEEVEDQYNIIVKRIESQL